MSAPEVTRAFVEAVETGSYGFAIVNFANPDMVGHSGVIPACSSRQSRQLIAVWEMSWLQ